MILRLLIFSIVPLLLFGEGDIVYPQRPVCRATPCDDSENPYGMCMYCYTPGVDGDDLPGGSPVLTPQACAQFKSDVESYMVAFNQAYQDAAANIEGLKEESSDIKSNVVILRNLNVIDDPITNRYVEYQLDNIDTLADSVWNYAAAIQTDVENVSNTVAQIVRQVRNLDCDNQVCSGSGSNTSCPCTDEIQEIIDTLTSAPFTTIDDIYDRQLDMISILRNIEFAISNCSSVLDFVWHRLHAPDDRMYQDINEILKTYITTNGENFLRIVKRDWTMEGLLHDLRQHLATANGNSDDMHLSTEGMIALYNALGQYMNYAVNSYNNDQQITFFSNAYKRVFSYYDLFNQSFSAVNASQGKNNLGAALDNASMRNTLYSVATNSVIPSIRYRMLQSGGGLSNWFSRIEFYLQSSLGWFDSPVSSEVIENQEQLTESSFEHSLNNSTNSLSDISVASSSNRLSQVWRNFSNCFSSYSEYQLNAPSRLVLSPSFGVGDYKFPGVIVNPSVDWADYIDPIRSATSFIAYGSIIVSLLLAIRYLVLFTAIGIIKILELFKE